MAYQRTSVHLSGVSRVSLAGTEYTSSFCGWNWRRIGCVGRGNFDLSDLPVYPSDQIKLDRTINSQMSLCFIDWQYYFGVSIPNFNGDLRPFSFNLNSPALSKPGDRALFHLNVCSSKKIRPVLEPGRSAVETGRRRSRGATAATNLRHTASMKMFSPVGFPLKAHMTTRFSRFCHHTLADYGPNDGTTSLSDLINWPGKIFPAWGMDHYFRPENEARNLVAAMFKYLAEECTGEK